MDIEKLSVNAVENIISKVDKLKSYINTGEKEVSFDGYVGIFSDNYYSKKNFKRVNVQVKGKEIKSIPSKPSYPVSIADLQNYINNGGVIFFVVYLDSCGEVLDIYYNSILPFNGQNILKNKSDNKRTISIELRPFPTNNNEIFDLFTNFFVNSQRQTSFISLETPSLRELEKNGELERLTFSYSASNTDYKSDFPFFIEGKELYLYAITKSSPIPIPVQHIKSVEKISGKRIYNEPISINDHIYYDEYEVEVFKKSLIIRIGECLKIKAYDFNEKFVKIDFNIKLKGTLNTRIRDLTFLINFFKNNGFTISNQFFPIDTTKLENSDISPKRLENQLELCLQIKQLLDILRIKKDLDIDNCTENDFNRIDTLIDCIIDNKPRKFKKKPEIISFYKISNISILLLFIETESGIMIYDFYNKKIKVKVEYDDGKEYEISQFYRLSKKTIASSDNVDYGFIINDFKEQPYSKPLFEEAQLVMLEMLKYFDDVPSTELFNVIKEFSNWFLENIDYCSYDICLLNHFQIIARERELSMSEKTSIMDIFNNNTDTIIKMGCAVLLKEQQEVNKLMKVLPKDEQDRFKQFPIWNIL